MEKTAQKVLVLVVAVLGVVVGAFVAKEFMKPEPQPQPLKLEIQAPKMHQEHKKPGRITVGPWVDIEVKD